MKLKMEEPMSSLFKISMFCISYIPILVLFAIIPYINRKTVSFGVATTEENYHLPEIRKIRDFYRNMVLGTGGGISLIVLMLLFILPEKTATYWFAGGLFLELFIFIWLYLTGHKKMRQIKRTLALDENKVQFVVVDTRFRTGNFLASPFWFLAYLPVIGLTLWVGAHFFDRMPDQVAIHFGLSGQPDRWAVKSFGLIFFAPLMQLVMAITMVFCYWVISSSKQQIDPANPGESLQKNRQFRKAWSIFLVFCGLAMLFLFGMIQLSFVQIVQNPWIMIGSIVGIVALAMIGSIIISVKYGQGGANLKSGKKGEPASSGIKDDDRFWKWGAFYFNPADPSLFIEKRFGIGWTCNFARPACWVIIAGFIVMITGIMLFSFVLLG